jgi:hypothetical protein
MEVLPAGAPQVEVDQDRAALAAGIHRALLPLRAACPLCEPGLGQAQPCPMCALRAYLDATGLMPAHVQAEAAAAAVGPGGATSAAPVWLRAPPLCELLGWLAQSRPQ